MTMLSVNALHSCEGSCRPCKCSWRQATNCTLNSSSVSTS